MPKKRQRRGMSSLSSSGGDSDAWASIGSSTECISPTPQPLSPCQVMISDGLCSQIGDSGELLGDQQLSLTPIPAIEINPDKNLNPEVHSFEGFSPEQGDVITSVQHNTNQITSVGAIGRFGKDTSSEELIKALIDAGFGGVTVERMYKVVHTTAGNVLPQAHAHVAIAVVTTLQTMEVVLRSGKLEKWRKLDKFKSSSIGMLQGRSYMLEGLPWCSLTDQTLNISMVTQSGGKDQYSSKAQPTKLVSVGTQTGDELITPTSPNSTVTQLVELLARTLTAVTHQAEDLNLKDLIIEIAKDTFKSRVLNTSANNERLLTAQPQYNDCSDPSNLMTTLDLPTTQLLPTHIIVGDFNAHNPLWEPAKSPNTTGRNLEQILQNNPSLVLLTPPSLPTYFNVYQNSFSTLDLTFLSAVLQPIAFISTEQDLGSDHYPIVTCIGEEPSSVRYKSHPSWRFGSGKWVDWSAALQQPEMPEILEESSTSWVCGVRGPILRWLHSYLTNRSFQIYFEGSYSSVRGARSGVPQGGILSPMLFNLMISDIPIQTGVQSCEYADDLTFFTAHKDLHVATNKLQTQMDSLNKWSQEWGLKINCTKTKTM
ncbi:Endonuclease/exonuclease/phosphatase [Trinorchestia longiramus]|nr:Endonuclease/exonuclease/phosphatase [Trinorchestia longiramus]